MDEEKMVIKRGSKELTILHIVKYGNDVLTTACERVTLFDEELKELSENMAATMSAAQGVGLSAPQIGVNKRFFVVNDGKTIYSMANPEIVETHGTQRDKEGCLSLPGFYEMVARPRHITIRAWTIEGKERTIQAKGFFARALLHEIDHLDGKLFIYHLSYLKRDKILKRIRKMRKAMEW